MLERVLALALLIFGLLWAASSLGTPGAPEPGSPETPPAPDEPTIAPPPPAAPPREPPAGPDGKRPSLLGGVLGPGRSG